MKNNDIRKNILIVLGIIFAVIIIISTISFYIKPFGILEKNEESKENVESAETTEESNNYLYKITITNYMDAFNRLDITKMLALIDTKAACAWLKCDSPDLPGKEKEFQNKYDSLTDNEIAIYTNQLKDDVRVMKDMNSDNSEDNSITLIEIGDKEKVSGVDNLTKVKAKASDESKLLFYLYNDKIVSIENDES